MSWDTALVDFNVIKLSIASIAFSNPNDVIAGRQIHIHVHAAELSPTGRRRIIYGRPRSAVVRKPLGGVGSGAVGIANGHGISLGRYSVAVIVIHLGYRYINLSIRDRIILFRFDNC